MILFSFSYNKDIQDLAFVSSVKIFYFIRIVQLASFDVSISAVYFNFDTDFTEFHHHAIILKKNQTLFNC